MFNEIYKIIDKKMPTDLTLSSNVIGDISYPTSSRGARENNVCMLERRDYSEEDLLFMKNNTHINSILEKLSYEDSL
jgi:hypothetical protein